MVLLNTIRNLKLLFLDYFYQEYYRAKFFNILASTNPPHLWKLHHASCYFVIITRKHSSKTAAKKQHTGISGLLTQELDAALWMLELDAGLWTLDSGRWTVDAGRWALDAGLWTLDATLRKLGPGH